MDEIGAFFSCARCEQKYSLPHKYLHDIHVNEIHPDEIARRLLKGYRQQREKGRKEGKGTKEGRDSGSNRRREKSPRSFSTLIPLKEDPRRIGAIARQKSDFLREGGRGGESTIDRYARRGITRARTSFVRNGLRVADHMTVPCIEVTTKHIRLNVHVCRYRNERPLSRWNFGGTAARRSSIDRIDLQPCPVSFGTS